MVTDPNIILSGNQMAQPRLPDVNAMMQTRTAAMENIYALEQQRAAQQQTAQKERAAAQEAATLKALLPAYTYGIQTGDIAGAGNLVPPEMRPQIQQYIDALTGKPPEEVQAALIGSLSSSQAGQEALAAIQRAATVDVQRGQLDVSKQRLAFDKSQANQPPQMTPYQAEMIKLAQARDTREAGKVSPEAAKQQQAIREIDTAITKISEVAEPGGLIDMSTNSIAGNLLDNIVAQVSGGTLTLPGDVAAAQMEVIAHLARMAVPRFEGPQGVADAAIYERASGQLSDPTTSNTTKRAAAQTVVEMLKARRDQFAFSGAGNGGGASAAGGADSGVLEYDADGNLIE
jgi:hypothetical protein